MCRRAASASLADRLAGDDAIEPRSQPCRVADVAPLAPGPFERGLDSVLRLVAISGDQAGQPNQARIVGAHEGVQRHELDARLLRADLVGSRQGLAFAHCRLVLAITNDRPAEKGKRTTRLRRLCGRQTLVGETVEQPSWPFGAVNVAGDGPRATYRAARGRIRTPTRLRPRSMWHGLGERIS